MQDINRSPQNNRLQAIDKLADQSEIGYAATIVTNVLAPKIERRLALLLDHFEHVSPDLPSMLDLRAQITEVWRIKKQLDLARADGSRAANVLETIVSGGSILTRKEVNKNG